jgi:hypothetical protein
MANKFSVWWALERKQAGVPVRVWMGNEMPRGDAMKVEVQPWEIAETTRTAFEKKAREEFERRLSDYCDQLEEKARSIGYVRTKELRNADHLRWLAGYQVCRFSRSAIADALDVRLNTIQYAINTFAKEIELTLRSPSTYRRVSSVEILAALTRKPA